MPPSPIRALRPALSQRWLLLQRRDATTVADTAKPSFARRNRGRIAWSAAALGTGVIIGNLVVHTIAPPTLPDAGTAQDKILIADLNERIDNDFKVQVLRGKCLGVANQLKGQAAGWVELVREEKELVQDNLMTSLAGFKGLGVERLFWNHRNEKLVAIVWLGPSLSGWPGVTHGGVIATQLSEKIGLMSTLLHGRHTISPAAIPQRLPGTGNHAKMPLPDERDEPEELSLSYVKPTYANDFYVIRVGPALALQEDPAHIIPSEPKQGHDYEATLETMDGKILVKAKAKMPASLSRLERKAEQMTVQAYEQFKQWMWPSRQSAASV